MARLETSLGWILILALGLAACRKEKKAHDDEAGEAAAEPQPTVSTSDKLRMKRVDVLGADLSAALGLPLEKLCEEAGERSCLGQVHRIALGGVEAYDQGISEPLSEATPNSVIALERVVLTACGRRAELEVEGSADRVFLGAELTGRVVELSEGALNDAVGRLYQRILARDPEAHERAALIALYSSAVSAQPEDAAKAWLATACYALASSTEFVLF